MDQLVIVPGGAGEANYRALVLARDDLGLPVASLSSAAGTEAVRLSNGAGSAPLTKELEKHRRRAYRIELDQLAPNRLYELTVTAGGAVRRVAVRALPTKLPPEGIRLAVASCFYDGFNKADGLGAALRQPNLGGRPDFEVWAGDNLYLDVPGFGLLSRNLPFEQTVERYLRYFANGPYMAARASAPNYTTYDDHEFWNDYPEPQAWLPRSQGPAHAGYERAARDCLDFFQSSLNPDPVAGGRSFAFEIDPLSFFFADVRSNRKRHAGGASHMFSRDDLRAAVEWARELEGPGVLVLGQPLWIPAGGLTDHGPLAFRDDYMALWNALWRAPFDVLVISGDVHFSRALRLSSTGRQVCELVSSPAAHIPTAWTSWLPWQKQDRGQVEVMPPSGARTRVEYEFGTSASNSIGVISFTPRGSGNVEVGAAFLDYTSGQPRAAAVERNPGGGYTARHGSCSVARLWTLRRRDGSPIPKR